jgi:hypothetical protein
LHSRILLKLQIEPHQSEQLDLGISSNIKEHQRLMMINPWSTHVSSAALEFEAVYDGHVVVVVFITNCDVLQLARAVLMSADEIFIYHSNLWSLGGINRETCHHMPKKEMFCLL